MHIDEITKNISKTKGRRVGRGSGSGRGTTAGRGTKGQKSRSGSSIPKHFEGGQTPLVRRIPKKKGFKSVRRLKTFIINLHHLEKFLDGGKLTIASLYKKGYLKKGESLKILGSHGLSSKVAVETHRISKSAKESIEAAGGKVVII